MDIHEGKYAWMVKIGEKGQFVIPKQARELFDLQPGDEILVLGDQEKGIAILPKEKEREYETMHRAIGAYIIACAAACGLCKDCPQNARAVGGAYTT